MLIGLMFLKNGIVYIQFHPVAYMIKLNIEMSMASLIVKIARNSASNADFMVPPPDTSYNRSHSYGGAGHTTSHTIGLQTGANATAVSKMRGDDSLSFTGIKTFKEVDVTVSSVKMPEITSTWREVERHRQSESDSGLDDPRGHR